MIITDRNPLHRASKRIVSTFPAPFDADVSDRSHDVFDGDNDGAYLAGAEGNAAKNDAVETANVETFAVQTDAVWKDAAINDAAEETSDRDAPLDLSSDAKKPLLTTTTMKQTVMTTTTTASPLTPSTPSTMPPIMTKISNTKSERKPLPQWKPLLNW